METIKIVTKPRSFFHKVMFKVLYIYYTIKDKFTYTYQGIKWILTGYEGVYYDYTNKRVLIINGYEYIQRVTTDLGEIVFFKSKDKDKPNIVCERF